MSLADRIRERLERVGKSASGASLEAGLSRSAIQDILSGSSASPRLDTLLKLAKPLQCSIQFLVSDEGEPDLPTLSNYRDHRLDTVIRDIEGGVFRREWPDDWKQRDEGAKAGIVKEYPVADDPRLPDQKVRIYRMGDLSMVEAGILKGDILYVAGDSSEQIDLFPGQIVLLQRYVGDGKLSEFAVRQVTDEEGGIGLMPRHAFGDFEGFTIPYTTFGSANAYSMEDGWLTIQGTVCAIYRELPVLSEGKILQNG